MANIISLNGTVRALLSG